MCLESTFSAILNLLKNEQTTIGEYISSALSFAFLIINCGLMISIPLLLLVRRKDHEDDDSYLNTYFSELTDKLNVLRLSRLFYHPAFIFRRLVFIATVFLLEDYLTFQIQMFVICNLLYLCYLIGTKPVLIKEEWLEIFNECCTLVISQVMIVYTDYVNGAIIKHYFGYFFIGVFAFNIIVNFTVIIYTNIVALYMMIKRYCFQKFLKQMYQ